MAFIATRRPLLYKPPVAAAGPWTPASLSGLTVWLDASDSGSVIRSGADVSAWNDKSGNGNNFPGTNNPQYSATGFNTSYPGIAVTSAAGSYFKSGAVALNSANLSVFIVGNITSPDLDDGVISLLGNGQSADWNNAASFVVDPNDTSNRIRLFTASGAYQSVITGAANGAHAFGWVFDGTNGTPYLDGTSGTPAAKTGAFGNPSAIIALGNRLSTGGAVTGDTINGTYAEVIITASAITGTDLANLDSYFVAKWGTP